MAKDGIKVWDVIIVGGGAAGCTAAIVLARSHRSVLLIDEGHQRNIKSHGMHNFLTRDGILPPDFLKLAHEELSHYPITIQKGRIITACGSTGKFELTDKEGKHYHARRLLLATGVTDAVPDVPGMKELWGCAIFHCPFCDGWENTDKEMGLYSRKINGYGMALSLHHFTKKLTLYTDGAHNLKAAQRAELEKRGIHVVTKRVKELDYLKSKLRHVVLENGHKIACESMFVNNGFKVNNELYLQMGGRCTIKGAAIINRHQECNVKGLYIAGDAAVDAHFVVVAAAQGTRAAVAIHEDLLKEQNRVALLVKDEAKEEIEE